MAGIGFGLFFVGFFLGVATERFASRPKEPIVIPSAESRGYPPCVCGHKKEQHIYYEGACRPGFVCERECLMYVKPLRYARVSDFKSGEDR